MMQWHKKSVDKLLRFFGFSNYQGMWISFIKGLIVGGLITFYLLQ